MKDKGPRPRYTHTDRTGMRWRFQGSRPISELADLVMREAVNPNPVRKGQREREHH